MSPRSLNSPDTKPSLATPASRLPPVESGHRLRWQTQRQIFRFGFLVANARPQAPTLLEVPEKGTKVVTYCCSNANVTGWKAVFRSAFTRSSHHKRAHWRKTCIPAHRKENTCNLFITCFAPFSARSWTSQIRTLRAGRSFQNFRRLLKCLPRNSSNNQQWSNKAQQRRCNECIKTRNADGRPSEEPEGRKAGQEPEKKDKRQSKGAKKETHNNRAEEQRRRHHVQETGHVAWFFVPFYMDLD